VISHIKIYDEHMSFIYNYYFYTSQEMLFDMVADISDDIPIIIDLF